jgi:hypothetical protein
MVPKWGFGAISNNHPTMASTHSTLNSTLSLLVVMAYQGIGWHIIWNLVVDTLYHSFQKHNVPRSLPKDAFF